MNSLVLFKKDRKDIVFFNYLKALLEFFFWLKIEFNASCKNNQMLAWCFLYRPRLKTLFYFPKMATFLLGTHFLPGNGGRSFFVNEKGRVPMTQPINLLSPDERTVSFCFLQNCVFFFNFFYFSLERAPITKKSTHYRIRTDTPNKLGTDFESIVFTNFTKWVF